MIKSAAKKPKKAKKLPVFETKVLICSCNSPEHQMVFMKDNTYPEVYVQVHLVKRSFWYRLKYAVKYIFGYKSRYGAWDEFILDHTHAETLMNISEHLVDDNLHSISYH
jgi:hypothetical protein